ncbi:DUF4304 domain-containing protein [Steroidobacter cummioxidans]|uniref:DUF4304 domain-containing protein n=1 Tax=Steroidobacter cummioxidans TaxID=1803913 RepID=UPI0013793CC0|nr:DUF4304 domain-containing protein [Steroidobacter cummioxidans]
MDAEYFKKSIAPLLKSGGFKRYGTTWRRDQVESIAVFNVQKSQWGGGIFYVNLGTYFRSLGDDALPTENKCHVRVRLDIEDPGKVAANALSWFAARAVLRDAALLAEEDSKRGLVFKEVRRAVVT